MYTYDKIYNKYCIYIMQNNEYIINKKIKLTIKIQKEKGKEEYSIKCCTSII